MTTFIGMPRVLHAVLLPLLVLMFSGARAAEIIVTTFDDVIDANDGVCSLREAVLSANTNATTDTSCVQGAAEPDRILLGAGRYSLNLSVGTNEDAALDGDLDITAPLEIRGVSPDYTIIDGIAGASVERVIHVIVSGTGTVLRNLRVTGGSDTAGGNIRVDGAASIIPALTLIDVVVDEGSATTSGGGLAVVNNGSADLMRTVVRSNRAPNGGGGGISVQGRLTVTDSQVVDNVSSAGGGILAISGRTSIIRSEISGNVAEGVDAEAVGGGILINGGELRLQLSRIQGNQGDFGGGIYVSSNDAPGEVEILRSAVLNNAARVIGGGLLAGGDVAIRHTTFAGNTATDGGAAYSNTGMTLFDAVTIAGNSGGGVFNQSGALFEFSLLANNAGGNCLGNAPTAATPNLDGDGTCQFNPNDGALNTDPLLGPLADNGGPTLTFALLPGSPAIDVFSSEERMGCGPSNNPNILAVPDQRGYPRGQPPQGVNDVTGQPIYFCDLGAFEVHAPYVVDNTADEVDEDPADGLCRTASGTCTLRAAVQQANATEGLEEIELPAGEFALTLAGADENDAATGDLDLRDPVIIRGAGPGQTIIDGARLDRVFDVLLPKNDIGPERPTKPHLFRDLTIRNGLLAGSEAGGGMRVHLRRGVELQRTILADNVSKGFGGAVGCVADCQVMVIDSRFTGNTAAGGGGIGQNPEDDPSAETGSVRIERSEFSGNTAISGGAIVVSDLTLRNSTVSDNHALNPSPGNGFGGGVVAIFGVIENSTIVANTAAADAAGGGIALPRIASVITGSVLAQNESGAAGTPDNCAFLASAALLSSGGHNLSDTEDLDCNLDQPTDLALTDPLLGPLADNGGLTQTHALLPGSPGIDAGDDSRCGSTDQRGVLRPDDGDGDGTAACDIGAFELASADLSISVSDTPDPAVVGNTVEYAITVANNGQADASGLMVTATLPAGLSFVSASGSAPSCSESAAVVSCDLDDLPVTGIATIRIDARADQAGTFSVPVSVSAAEPDGMSADNSVTETTVVNAASGGGGSGGGGGGAVDPFFLLLTVALACYAFRGNRLLLSGGKLRTISFTKTEENFRERIMNGLRQSTLMKLLCLAGIAFLTACGGGGGGAAPGSGSGGGDTSNVPPSVAAMPTLSFEPVKIFRFSWTDVADATHYQLLENPDNSSGFTQVGSDIAQGIQELRHEVPLHARINAQYLLRSCNANGCTDSANVFVADTMVDSIGYFKASNSDPDDGFGIAVAMSQDGSTLAVGAPFEASNGIDDPIIGTAQENNSALDAGAVYVFIRVDAGRWSQQAYVKSSDASSGDEFGSSVSLSADGNSIAIGAPGVGSDTGAVYLFGRESTGTWSQQARLEASNADDLDQFGGQVSLSGDGNTLAIGAQGEDSNATRINGDGSNNDAKESGAAYVFARSGTSWSQQAYIKAENARAGHGFGSALSLSSSSSLLAVGAMLEDSDTIGIDGNGSNNDAAAAGAAYVFARGTVAGGPPWVQEAYVKASNTDAEDRFGRAVSISGNTLAVGATGEASSSSNVDTGQDDNTADFAGAVYVFARTEIVMGVGSWRQQAYLKPNNAGAGDLFGAAVSLSSNGSGLAIGATRESSSATGVNGDSNNEDAFVSGAAYLFRRNGGVWQQHAYIKASNAARGDRFGPAISLSGDGNTLAIGALDEASAATDIDGDQSDNSAVRSGAVYVY